MLRLDHARYRAQADDGADISGPESVIGRALGATPVNERDLRQGVWSFVGMERDAGVLPGSVIVALAAAVRSSGVLSVRARQALMRRVMLWFVEAYFGHLDGDIASRDGNALADAPLSSDVIGITRNHAVPVLAEASSETVLDARNAPSPAIRSRSVPAEEWYPDWRRRLTRNLSRPSDGRWDVLTHPVDHAQGTSHDQVTMKRGRRVPTNG